MKSNLMIANHLIAIPYFNTQYIWIWIKIRLIIFNAQRHTLTVELEFGILFLSPIFVSGEGNWRKPAKNTIKPYSGGEHRLTPSHWKLSHMRPRVVVRSSEQSVAQTPHHWSRNMERYSTVYVYIGLSHKYVLCTKTNGSLELGKALYKTIPKLRIHSELTGDIRI